MRNLNLAILAATPRDGKREQKKVKTVLRTIRLPEDLEIRLEELAAQRGIAMNALAQKEKTIAPMKLEDRQVRPALAVNQRQKDLTTQPVRLSHVKR